MRSTPACTRLTPPGCAAGSTRSRLRRPPVSSTSPSSCGWLVTTAGSSARSASVTMRDPSTVYLDWDVDLAPDVTLEPNVILRGATSVEEGSVIGAGSQLVDARIGRRARIWASVIESSTVEDGASVGPFSHLRPG